MNPVCQRGDIYYANLGSGIGSEQVGSRPVVIIQNNILLWTSLFRQNNASLIRDCLLSLKV